MPIISGISPNASFSGEVSAADISISGLTGATSGSRYVGATASGAPASGTFATGDFVIDRSGSMYVCTAAGTPGTWAQMNAALSNVSVTGNGASGRVPVAQNNSQASWKEPPGFQYDYVELTSSVVINGTTAATATTVIDGNAVSFDGATRVLVEFWAAAAEASSGAGAIFVNLHDGATDLGRLCYMTAASATTIDMVIYGARFLTPSNASHTFHVVAWRTAAAGQIVAGAGGTDVTLPAWYRVTKA